MSTKQLDLILVNPSNRRRAYQSLGTDLAAVEPPVWARLLASFCLRRGLAVVIIDAEAEDLTPEQVAENINLLKPILTAVVVYGHQPSASTQNMTAAGKVCDAIKLDN